MKPEDVPDELIDLFADGSHTASCAYTGNSPIVSENEYMRGGLAPALTAYEPVVREQVTEEIAAQRDALARVMAQWSADVVAIRAQIAAEIEAQKAPCYQHSMSAPRPSCWQCARYGATHRAARIARGEG